MKIQQSINVEGKVQPNTKTAGVKSKFSEKRTYQNSENVHNFINTCLVSLSL